MADQFWNYLRVLSDEQKGMFGRESCQAAISLLYENRDQLHKYDREYLEDLVEVMGRNAAENNEEDPTTLLDWSISELRQAPKKLVALVEGAAGHETLKGLNHANQLIVQFLGHNAAENFSDETMERLQDIREGNWPAPAWTVKLDVREYGEEKAEAVEEVPSEDEAGSD